MIFNGRKYDVNSRLINYSHASVLKLYLKGYLYFKQAQLASCRALYFKFLKQQILFKILYYKITLSTQAFSKVLAINQFIHAIYI